MRRMFFALYALYVSCICDVCVLCVAFVVCCVVLLFVVCAVCVVPGTRFFVSILLYAVCVCAVLFHFLLFLGPYVRVFGEECIVSCYRPILNYVVPLTCAAVFLSRGTSLGRCRGRAGGLYLLPWRFQQGDIRGGAMEEREQQRERVHPEALEEGPEEKANRAAGKCTMIAVAISYRSVDVALLPLLFPCGSVAVRR